MSVLVLPDKAFEGFKNEKGNDANLIFVKDYQWEIVWPEWENIKSGEVSLKALLRDDELSFIKGACCDNGKQNIT